MTTWTSAQVLDVVAARVWPGPEWLVVSEVTMGRGQRRCDAVALSLWPSRGYRVFGVEVKVDRRDWLRELADPRKADLAIDATDAFYVVAPRGVAEIDEIPAAWGFIEIVGDDEARARVRRRRSPKPSQPGPVSRAFLSSLLTAAVRPRRQVLGRLVREGVSQELLRQQEDVSRYKKRLDEAVGELRTFKNACGETLHAHPETLANLISLARRMSEVAYARRQVLQGTEQLERVVQGLRDALGLAPDFVGAAHEPGDRADDPLGPWQQIGGGW